MARCVVDDMGQRFATTPPDPVEQGPLLLDEHLLHRLGRRVGSREARLGPLVDHLGLGSISVRGVFVGVVAVVALRLCDLEGCLVGRAQHLLRRRPRILLRRSQPGKELARVVAGFVGCFFGLDVVELRPVVGRWGVLGV